MTEQPQQDIDISADDLDVQADREPSATGDPESYQVDETVGSDLGGLGGSETTGGGAG